MSRPGGPWWFWTTASVGAVVVLYGSAFAAYAIIHRVGSERLSANFLLLHRGAIWYRDDSFAGTLAITCFHPANWLLFHAVGIDMEVHTGDSFGYEFCRDDYIDGPDAG